MACTVSSGRQKKWLPVLTKLVEICLPELTQQDKKSHPDPAQYDKKSSYFQKVSVDGSEIKKNGFLSWINMMKIAHISTF